jgi:hypothetical protein
MFLTRAEFPEHITSRSVPAGDVTRTFSFGLLTPDRGNGSGFKVHEAQQRQCSLRHKKHRKSRGKEAPPDNLGITTAIVA